MYIVAHHRIADPSRFWDVVQSISSQLPDGLALHQCLPRKDGTEAVCVWEAHSLNGVRSFIEAGVGDFSTNEYFDAVAKEGINVPRRTAT